LTPGFDIFQAFFVISANVQAFTNPHWLKLQTDPAQRKVRRVEDLASAGLSAGLSTSENASCGPRGVSPDA